MTKRLPERPSLSSLKYQAKQLVKQHHAGDTAACEALRALSRWSGRSDDEILADDLVLADAQHAVALAYGFPSWIALRTQVGAAADASEPGPPLVLSDAQRAEFRRRGLLRLPGFLPDDVTTPVREGVRALLEQSDVVEDGVWSADRARGMDYFANQKHVLRRLKEFGKGNPAVAALCTAELQDIAEQLLDRRPLTTLVVRPQLLFTPPNAEQWELPHKMWHMDVPRLDELGCSGVQVFTFIEAVGPDAGGTVVAAGSHHYINDRGKVRSKQVKKALQSHPWFKRLMHPDGGDRRRFLEEPVRDGEIELQVVELTGEPGDVWLMDLRVLHSLTPNTSDRPRLMATQRYYLEALIQLGFNGGGRLGRREARRVAMRDDGVGPARRGSLRAGAPWRARGRRAARSSSPAR